MSAIIIEQNKHGNAPCRPDARHHTRWCLVKGTIGSYKMVPRLKVGALHPWTCRNHKAEEDVKRHWNDVAQEMFSENEWQFYSKNSINKMCRG